MNKKLTLEQFKTTVLSDKGQKELKKMTGGILGACHFLPDLSMDLKS
jgi:hypothetical protein